MADSKPMALPGHIEEIERRLAFLMTAAANDEINPTYLELLGQCHSLALDALAP